jgi:hypothetical protein
MDRWTLDLNRERLRLALIVDDTGFVIRKLRQGGNSQTENVWNATRIDEKQVDEALGFAPAFGWEFWPGKDRGGGFVCQSPCVFVHRRFQLRYSFGEIAI